MEYTLELVVLDVDMTVTYEFYEGEEASYDSAGADDEVVIVTAEIEGSDVTQLLSDTVNSIIKSKIRESHVSKCELAFEMMVDHMIDEALERELAFEMMIDHMVDEALEREHGDY